MKGTNIFYSEQKDYFLNGVLMGKNLELEVFLKHLKRDLQDDRYVKKD